jgi:hypothetical protein
MEWHGASSALDSDDEDSTRSGKVVGHFFFLPCAFGPCATTAATCLNHDTCPIRLQEMQHAEVVALEPDSNERAPNHEPSRSPRGAWFADRNHAKRGSPMQHPRSRNVLNVDLFFRASKERGLRSRPNSTPGAKAKILAKLLHAASYAPTKSDTTKGRCPGAYSTRGVRSRRRHPQKRRLIRVEAVESVR